jgi:acyl-CoA thioester hydrolase
LAAESSASKPSVLTLDESVNFGSPIPPYEISCDVSAAHIDELGHVNNVVYLSWVQDVAIAHWNSLTTPELRARLVWVALRHEIDYKAEAVLGDRIIARTWTGVGRGLRYARHTKILRASDGVLLAEAVTQWCPMDAASRKPTRLPAEIAAYFGKA